LYFLRSCSIYCFTVLVFVVGGGGGGGGGGIDLVFFFSVEVPSEPPATGFVRMFYSFLLFPEDEAAGFAVAPLLVEES
jgi:hypothetical protein